MRGIQELRASETRKSYNVTGSVEGQFKSGQSKITVHTL